MQQNEIIIHSPMLGATKPMCDVEDAVFACEALGKGIAIIPVDGKVYAPEDGTVVTLFPTYHAIGIVTNSGVEVLIHIGINTVELNGKHFTPHTTQGSKVKKGDLLMEFDVQGIIDDGYITTTPIIITNTMDYSDILPTSEKAVEVGSDMLTIK